MAGNTHTIRVRYYNPEAVISVGYCVNSGRATHFRIWVIRVLKRHLVEGYICPRGCESPKTI
jgi:hypothetical protein